MRDAWIWLAVFAALLQALRTAAQKLLNERLSVLTTTYVRSLVGLPLMLAYLGGVIAWAGVPSAPPGRFFGYALVAALTQVAGTGALVSLFRTRSFATANQLARTNVVFTALVGATFFSDHIAAAGWMAIGMTLAGALMLSARSGPAAIGEANRSMTIRIDPRAAGTGLFIGLMFGVCNVSIREASLSLGGDAVMLRAAVTVVVVTAFQVVLIGAWLAWREKGFLAGIWGNRAQAAFIGAASALGSICWFTAFTLANASYVIAVGQIEAVFAILVSWLYFRERLRAIDFAGIAIIVAGVLLLRLAG